MWERFGQRGTKRSQAVEPGLNALEKVWGQFGRESIGREERAHGSAVWLGLGGVLTLATTIVLLFWLLGRRSRETALPDEEVVAPSPPSAEDVSPREEPPPGEERPERRGVTPTTPSTPREEPPPGEERPGER
jgi:hypothetical protein